MENISHSLPKRSFSSYSYSNAAFTSHKSVYDDVFGGPPKFGLPTLAPRLQDYSEIFGGFHASRSSSIPALHLPLIADDSELHFDVRSPGFDYSEVFGDFRGSAFTVSFEDLVGQSSGGYDSSDEPWSPTQSGSLSDELDPLAGSDKSHMSSDGDGHQSLESVKQFNVSHNKSSQGTMETVLTGTSLVTNFGAVPGYSFSHCQSPASWNGEDEYCSVHVTDDINRSKEFGGRVPEEKNYKKCLSNPLLSGFDFNPLENHESSTSPRDKPFMTVFDISLRTKPSRLPPPSRAPPALVVKKVESDISNSELKASKSCTFESVADDSAQLFFDVEVDATMSADGAENGNKNFKVKRKSTKESIERKDIQSNTKWHLEGVLRVEEKTSKPVRTCSSFEDEKMLRSNGKETSLSALAIEEKIGSTKGTEKTSGSRGVQYCNHIADNSAGAVAWKEATEYFEVTEKDIPRQAFETVEDCDTLMQHMNPDAYGHQRTTDYELFNQKEDSKKFKVTKEVARWDEKKKQPEMTGEDCDWGNKQQIRKPNTKLSDRKEVLEKVIPDKLAFVYELNKRIPENVQKLEKSEKLHIDHSGSREGPPEAKGNVSEVEAKLKLKASKTMQIEKRFTGAQIMKENSGKHKENIVREECQRSLEDVVGAETRERVKERKEQEGIEKQHSGACGKENENQLEETQELKENGIIRKESKKHGESGKKSYIAAGNEKNWDEQLACEVKKDNERIMETGKQKVDELKFRKDLEQAGNYKEQELSHEWKVIKERNQDASRMEANDLRLRMAEAKAGNRGEVFETKGNNHLSKDVGIQEELSGHAGDIKPIERDGHEIEVKWDLERHVLIEGDQLNVYDGACTLDEGNATKVAGKHDNSQIMEATQAAFSSEGNGELKNERKSSIYESEPGMYDPLVKGKFNRSSKNKDELQGVNTHSASNNTGESLSLPKQMTDSNTGGIGMGISCVMPDKTASALKYSHESEKIISTEDDGGQKMKGTQFIIEKVDISDSFTPCQVMRESLVNGRKVEDASSVVEHNEHTQYSSKNATKQRIERKDKNMKENLAAKGQKVGERKKEMGTENEHMRKIEEEREREREREKDRMAIDKAALEARERSYDEARERAERAAVERATAEVRQRAMAGARERLEKASMESRLRAERAAVERATAEARQRAAQKSMAEKAAFNSHDRLEKSVSDRFSASFRSADTRQSSLSSDLHFQSTGISNGLRYSYSSSHVGAEGESPQRCRARLERYRRTAERAANALAEKNKRDLLAQREREERNRVAEALDAEVKRWSSGKEGNLRALLSTLQYILGLDSGWQPVPLTEVITSAAVKKAYRKATLCVHPDKLQQRGATIQQKYICEKVFDLLKEAWNKFNSEER